ncbi:chromate transporter [Niallia sp. Krafla_26]|uniref:chromate transporter n=1 Tax=Niallia sp. Krafla_26 TaxID=3064703 RepID=UPI003D1869D6
MKKQWSLLFQIFWSFFKIGPITFGGGYAMIPMIEREVVTNKKWVKSEEITDVFAVSESVPGAIGINSATFIGYRIAGVKGAIAAMIGILLPTFSIVILLSLIYQFLRGNPIVDAAFMGIRAAIVALITYAGIKIGKTAIFDKTTVAITAITVIVLLFLTIHPVLIILTGIIVGILVTKIKTVMKLPIRLEKEEPSHTVNHSMAKEKEASHVS